MIYEYSQIDNTVLKLRTCFKAAVSEVPQSMRFGQIPFAFTCRSAFFRNSEKSQTIPRACGRSLVHDLQLAFSSLLVRRGKRTMKTSCDYKPEKSEGPGLEKRALSVCYGDELANFYTTYEGV